MTKRIKSVIDSATESDVQEGMTWYSSAQEYARLLSAQTGYTLQQVCGVIAALSPQKAWERNKRIAKQFLLGQPVPDQTQANLRKASRILAGEDPEDVLRSKYGYFKTLNFYRNLIGADCYVCVDRHTAAVATGNPKTNVRHSNYERIAQAYRKVAQILHITPSQAQAVAWVAWRRQYGKKLASQDAQA